MSVRVGKGVQVTWYGRGNRPSWSLLPYASMISSTLASDGFTNIRVNTDGQHLIISAVTPTNNETFPTDYFISIRFEYVARSAGWTIDGTDRLVVGSRVASAPSPQPAPQQPPGTVYNPPPPPPGDDDGFMAQLNKQVKEWAAQLGVKPETLVIGGSVGLVVLVILLKD